MISKKYKIVDKEENEKKVVPYTLYVGVIDIKNNSFNWFEVDTFEDLDKAYKRFKEFTNEQLKYTDKELQSIWGIGRLDIELKEGSKLINWVGIYSREVVVDGEESPVEKNSETPEGLKGLKKVEVEKENFKDCVGIKDEILKHIKDRLVKDINIKDLLECPLSKGRIIDYGSFTYTKRARDCGYKIIKDLEEKYPQLIVDCSKTKEGNYKVRILSKNNK